MPDTPTDSTSPSCPFCKSNEVARTVIGLVYIGVAVDEYLCCGCGVEFRVNRFTDHVYPE